MLVKGVEGLAVLVKRGEGVSGVRKKRGISAVSKKRRVG